ncbi:hypothetical protein [Janibacter sp. DB-40]|uniref:hypothetical protein n=1 Tax=Janibacter sp. DB-40 TaxID=3028808 RepID=UPI00240685CF|nr:hypothetical protein [Janibacter sp. DB-40]
MRKWSRKASIRHTGDCSPGTSPGVQPHCEIRSSTAGSAATSEAGTSWPGSSPATWRHGWWSPTSSTTRSGCSAAKETTDCSEYPTDAAYRERTSSAPSPAHPGMHA